MMNYLEKLSPSVTKKDHIITMWMDMEQHIPHPKKRTKSIIKNGMTKIFYTEKEELLTMN